VISGGAGGDGEVVGFDTASSVISRAAAGAVIAAGALIEAALSGGAPAEI
jgi:hypothetical protein